MEPLEILKNEHGLIRQFLENLDEALKKLEIDQRPTREFFDKAIQFVKLFPEGYHHHKEELVMFVQVAQKHAGEFDGEIEALRHQHEVARNYISNLALALNGYEEGAQVQTDQVIENTAAYVALMRNHIHKEDHKFFPMVEEVLTPEETDALMAEFDKEAKKAGPYVFEEAHKLVVDMGSILVHM
jgi:hemerythrin-like domain-containing protein